MIRRLHVAVPLPHAWPSLEDKKLSITANPHETLRTYFEKQFPYTDIGIELLFVNVTEAFKIVHKYNILRLLENG